MKRVGGASSSAARAANFPPPLIRKQRALGDATIMPTLPQGKCRQKPRAAVMCIQARVTPLRPPPARPRHATPHLTVQTIGREHRLVMKTIRKALPLPPPATPRHATPRSQQQVKHCGKYVFPFVVAGAAAFVVRPSPPPLPASGPAPATVPRRQGNAFCVRAFRQRGCVTFSI